MSVALPNVLQDKEYQIFVLISFFLIIVLVIPSYFYLQLFKEEKDIGGVDVENRKRFAKIIDETLMGKVIPGILG